MLRNLNNKRLILVYFSFPYTQNPRKCTEEIKALVRRVRARHPNIVPIVPHLVLASLYDFPRGYTKPEILLMEFELIYRCDMLCIAGNSGSRGVMWETVFARWLQRHGHPIKIVTIKELMNVDTFE